MTQGIHSLATFKRNSSGLMKRIKKTGRPLVLTIKGKAEAVLAGGPGHWVHFTLKGAPSKLRLGGGSRLHKGKAPRLSRSLR